MRFFNKFYLDKEKDILVNLYESGKDELTYLLETPNHKTGNLITNLAKICGLEAVKKEDGMKMITGKIPASINGDNEEVYIFRMGGIKIVNIYPDGKIEIKAKMPAIIKTLMSQTKDYKLPIQESIVKSYILKKCKLRTDLHTHMNAILSPDLLIALGIKHQIRYPLYFIRKINISLTDKQEDQIATYRKEVAKQYENSNLKGKALDRKIKDETYINFADLILNNIADAEENIAKIRNSLAIMKDGQAVFTNLEKLYLYRYIFTKGKTAKKQIPIGLKEIERIPEKDIQATLKKMEEDKKDKRYQDNNLLQDKLLWIAREYKKQGISYVEIAQTTLTSRGENGVSFLEDVHKILPHVEKETGVAIRFLAAVRRVWLTPEQTREVLDVLKATSKSPYVVGSDIIGEEINDIEDLEPVIKELVEYAVYEDKDYVIRIHAGENDSLRDNVRKAVECIVKAVPEGKKCPRFRIGHGLYGNDPESKEGKALTQQIKELGGVLEFQLTSNIRLNNLTQLEEHPIKYYIHNGINCVQGTDGCGFYGTDPIDEQLALQNLLGLTQEDFLAMKETEDRIIQKNQNYFIEKSKEFEEFLKGRSITEVILKQEEENIQNSTNKEVNLILNTNLEAKEVLKDKIKQLPKDKIPIIIAGGSFNSKGRQTQLSEQGKEILRQLVNKIDSQKAYFVVGHKMQGYEKALVELVKQSNKKFEIDAIIPKKVSKEVKEQLLEGNIDGVCVSTEPEELGIYKSFNYEIFERRNSVVVAFDGNSPVSNLIQEAKNGKAKAKIYVNENVKALKEKAESLEGYVVPFTEQDNIIDKILKDYPEIG